MISLNFKSNKLLFIKKRKILFKFISILVLILLIKIKINFYFFIENGKNKEYCKNYGLLVYDYHYSFTEPIKIVNIGDYIQSLAAFQYLPSTCFPILIDRDTLQYYHGPKVKLLMNGWFSIKEGNKFTSEQISPLYLSIHIENNISDERIITHLKKYEPIGCRDLYTYNLLINEGIKAFFSSCLTTTLDINYYESESFRNEEIIFTDFKFGYLEKADEFIQNLTAYNFSNITYLTHITSNKKTHLERFRIAHSLLKRYANTKLVITTRIHAALPCLALKTPVILVNKEYDQLRFNGIYNLLNTIGINSNNKFEIKVNINRDGFIYNSNEYLKYSEKLKKIIKKQLQI